MLHVTLADMRERLARETERLSAQAFERGSIEVRFYAPRGEDRQVPHDRDELYVVANGSGRFVVDGEARRFGPGDVLFAAAGAAHRFEDMSDDFETWVIFYGPPGGELG